MEELKKQKELLIAYQKLASSKEGQVVLDDLFKFTNHNRDVFNPDSKIMAYSLGRKSVSLRIGEMLSKDIKELDKEIKNLKNNPQDNKSGKEILTDD